MLFRSAILVEELLDRSPDLWPQARALLADCLAEDARLLPTLDDAVSGFAALSVP